MKRKHHVVPEDIKALFDDESFLSELDCGRMAKAILVHAFTVIEAKKNKDEVLKQTLEDFSKLLGEYAAGQRRMYWREFKLLYDSGVIKIAPLISYVQKSQGYTQAGAVKYIAETFGMNPSTQSVYLAEELELREGEKAATRRKRRRL